MKQTNLGIYINQAKYARNLVKRFGLDKAAHVRTPMAANAKLTSDPSSKSVDVTLYRSMIGCLQYLTANRPNIVFSVGVCSRFQSNPKVSHLNAVKRIPVPYTNLQLNPYPNTQSDLFCSDNLSFQCMAPST